VQLETTPPAPVLSGQQLIEVLDQLANVDAENAVSYAWCETHAQARELRALFTRRAAECLAASQELREVSLEHGARPQEAEPPRRGWRPPPGGADGDLRLLDAAAGAAAAALETHHAALRRDLPLTVLAVVQRQCEVEQRGHEDLRQLHEQLRTEMN
jgi:hypothetical protein